jgi:hypothetical protein
MGNTLASTTQTLNPENPTLRINNSAHRAGTGRMEDSAPTPLGACSNRLVGPVVPKGLFDAEVTAPRFGTACMADAVDRTHS